MADWTNILLGAVGGSIATIVLVVIAVLLALQFLKIKALTNVKFLLTKVFSRTSLMTIAVFDVIVAFDPTQIILGLSLGWICGIIVLLIELTHKQPGKSGLTKLFPALVAGIFATLLILIPTPIPGLLVAWFGVRGDMKKT